MASKSSLRSKNRHTPSICKAYKIDTMSLFDRATPGLRAGAKEKKKLVPLSSFFFEGSEGENKNNRLSYRCTRCAEKVRACKLKRGKKPAKYIRLNFVKTNPENLQG